MQVHDQLIANPASLRELCEKLSRETIIAFDTEFVRENTFSPQLALMQIATEREAWLIDNLAFGPDEIRPFLSVLTDSRILKVLHSAYGDQECLYETYQMTATPTLDTFEAASLLGYGESVSLRDLARSLLGIKMTKGHTRTDWLKRPIGPEMRAYALADVQYLVAIGQNILQELDGLGRRQWALDLSAPFENPKLYQSSSEQIASRLALSGRVSKRSYVILKDLIAWREGRARRLNLPRRRVADDGTLMDIANARPRTLHDLEKFRGLNKGEAQRQGAEILGIIERALKKPEESLPELPRMLRPNSGQVRVIDLVATYLRFLSEDLKVAPRHLLTTDKIRRIIVENLLDPDDWVEAGICPRQVADLVGKEISAMMQGRRAIAVQNGAMKILKIEKE
jgi:ribonuclease D